MRKLGFALVAAVGVAAFGCASDPDDGSGTGGGGNGAVTADCPSVPKDDMISDFEDGTNGVLKVKGRSGGWYSYNDGTGTQTPIPMSATVLPSSGGACGSKLAFKTSGMGFTMWGAGIGTDLAPLSGTAKQPYDASAYSGVMFQAKATGDLIVRFKVQDKNTVPEGGTCGMKCFDDFGSDVTLSTSWKLVKVPFVDMKQEGWAMQALPAVARNAMYGIQFQTKATPFELWIDNVAFY